jgi:hypothetical protein
LRIDLAQPGAELIAPISAHHNRPTRPHRPWGGPTYPAGQPRPRGTGPIPRGPATHASRRPRGRIGAPGAPATAGLAPRRPQRTHGPPERRKRADLRAPSALPSPVALQPPRKPAGSHRAAPHRGAIAVRAGRLRAASLRAVPPPPRRPRRPLAAPLAVSSPRAAPPAAAARRAMSLAGGYHPAAPRLQCALWCALQLPR